MTRDEFLGGLIGKPWRANAKGPDAYDCWHLVGHVRISLFDRPLPNVKIPQDASWSWMINAFETHPERANWNLVPPDAMGLVRAGDGAIVLMARTDRPAHSGIWLRPELRILHADPRAGVCFEPLSSLHMAGWNRLRFYEPRNQ